MNVKLTEYLGAQSNLAFNVCWPLWVMLLCNKLQMYVSHKQDAKEALLFTGLAKQPFL